MRHFSEVYNRVLNQKSYIFHSLALLSVAKTFFRNLSSKIAVSYVAVGTFKLPKLQDSDGKLESPFNKAAFREMPFFTLAEMGKLFELYKTHCDPGGISQH